MDVPERSDAWVIDVDHMPALFCHILSHLPHRQYIYRSEVNRVLKCRAPRSMSRLRAQQCPSLCICCWHPGMSQELDSACIFVFIKFPEFYSLNWVLEGCQTRLTLHLWHLPCFEQCFFHLGKLGLHCLYIYIITSNLHVIKHELGGGKSFWSTSWADPHLVRW